ncbi:MAG: ARMT1-like domain-containing protein [candidate division WOR-3 bacterium]
MRSSPRCLECGLEQCQRIVRLCGVDEKRAEILRKGLLQVAENLSLNEPPSTYTSKLLVATMEFLGNRDPFAKVKEEQNRRAQEMAARLDEKLAEGDEGLKVALKIAAAGNVIDVGPGRSFDINDLLARLHFAHDDSDLLIARLKKARRVVYILDNAGEVIFDKLVLRRLPDLELTIVARSSPILNDVTVEEAKGLGLDRLGRVIGTGSPYLGIDFNTVSEEFLRFYYEADLVIAKGHANFESLVNSKRDGFYLLTAKCEVVADFLGVKPGESVCLYSLGG